MPRSCSDSQGGATLAGVVIRADGIGKRYRVGERERYRALRDVIGRAISAPLRVRARGASGPAAGSDGQRLAWRRIWALRHVSVEISEGDVVGVVGLNGAGKTTLLKILSRITRPTEGTAEVRGRVGSLLEVGTAFHPELTGRENVYLSGAVLGMRRREIAIRFDDIVAFAGVQAFIDTPMKRYSTGMQTRLAFAVAAHLECDILLVDEVLAVGDLEFQKRCMSKMGDISRQGKTILFVSHNLQSLQSLCQRGVLLQDGRVALDDSITAVIERYVAMVRSSAGEASWPNPETAPGDGAVRIKAVRVLSRGRISADVDIDTPFDIEVDFWNLRDGVPRVVNFNLFNSLGVCVFSSFNTVSACADPVDAWAGKEFPVGLFRTTCSIPPLFLNDGPHSLAVGIHERSVGHKSVYITEILTFNVRDTGVMRSEYKGPWLGAVRPRLRWQTVILDEQESGDTSATGRVSPFTAGQPGRS